MIEHHAAVPTAAGEMNTFVCRPERGGPHPVILFLMDAPGIREELRDMVRRLASVGYYVMLPNLYYREGVEELGAFVGPANAAVRERMMALMERLTIPMVMDDVDALLAYAGRDDAASPGPAGCVGYCMSGQFAINAAARHSRIAAAASIYGTRLMTDRPDSPHRVAGQSVAWFYLACAEIDHWVPIETVAPLRDALVAAGADAEVELYPGVEHGFAFPQRPAYDRAAAERHWERLFTLFGAKLA